MEEKSFRIDINKVCPACGISCPELELDFEEIYANNHHELTKIRTFSCMNGSICRQLWSYLKNYKSSLDGHN